MGYVHDIHLRRDFDREAFAAAAADIRTLISRLEIPLAGPTGRPGTMPVVEGDYIALNGLNEFCTCTPEDPEYRSDRSCRWKCGRQYNDCGQPFVIDVRPGAALHPRDRDQYWFDCKTYYKPYDLAVMVSMIALKHHLGESLRMYSKPAWRWGWNSSRRHPGGAVGVYEHVFPERAPVQNILDQDEDEP